MYKNLGLLDHFPAFILDMTTRRLPFPQLLGVW